MRSTSSTRCADGLTPIEPLSRDEVRRALRRRRPPRPPTARLHAFPARETWDRYGEALQHVVARYPEDVLRPYVREPGYWTGPENAPEYCWAFGDKGEKRNHGLDASRQIIDDWSELDAFLEELPDPHKPDAMDTIKRVRAEHPDRYVAGSWSYCFFERPWEVRGMENLLVDLAEHPDRVKALLRGLCDLYKVWVRRIAEAGCDAIATTDDLGWQAGPMMSPAVFREILKPFYAELIAEAHAHGLDFWLHCCGNVTPLLEDFIEIGLDVLHPLQAGAMDEAEAVSIVDGRMTLHVGMDVQRLLPQGTPQEVYDGCRRRIRAFWREEGGLILGAGNAILADTPLANIEAYYEAIFAPV